MAKQKSIILNVPQPCQENWDKMTVNERGRHCESCNKTVVDFSNYTDRELATFLKNISGSVCGRLNNYQVNRPILFNEQPNRSFIHKLFLGTALASWFGISSTSSAQNITPKTAIQKVDTTKKINSPSTIQAHLLDNVTYAKGTIIDTKASMRAAFATLVLKSKINNSIVDSVISDSNGSFTLLLPDKYIGQSLNLEVVLKSDLSRYNYIFLYNKFAPLKLEGDSNRIQIMFGEFITEENIHTVGAMCINVIQKDVEPFSTTYKSTYSKEDIQHMAKP